ncbi:hypothetical protein XELAEV_18042222mg [Xenopus laevis]|nr:hypothetical protein XELAEV_18042222mg [Xenopus laevis]
MCLRDVATLFTLTTLLKVSIEFPTGAPTSACETMMPGHPGVVPQSSPSPYIIKTNSSSYTKGNPIQVQIIGPGYRGILLESRTFRSTATLGTWLQPVNNTKVLSCPENSRGAMTHSNIILKTQATTYTWMPPETVCPNIIFFIATIAEGYDTYWLGVRSSFIWRDSSVTCSNGTTVPWISSVSVMLLLLLLLLF